VRIRRLIDTGGWTTRRYLSLLGAALVWLIVAIDAWYLWPSQLGGHTSMVIVSGVSMEPTYFDGDLVIARKMEPSIGDVIIYAPEGLGGSQIVHRIIGGNAEDGWQMQGDNNDFVDPFTPRGDEVKGVVLVHYSNFGRISVLLLNPMVWAFVLLAAIVLLLWWSGDCDDDEDDDAGDEDSDNREDDATGGGGDDAEVSAGGDVPVDADGPVEADADAVAEPQPEVTVAGMRIWRRWSRRTAIITASVVTAAGLFVAPASASQLNVHTRAAAMARTVSKCATQTLAATTAGSANAGAYSSVSVSGFATACQGKAATVYLYNAAGTLLSSGTVASTAATTTFPTGTYQGTAVSRVVVKVNGWVFLPTWKPPVNTPALVCEAINPGGQVSTSYPCTLTMSPASTSAWGYDNGTMLWNFTLNVAWTTQPPNSNWRWRITADFTKTPPFLGFIPRFVGSNSPGAVTLSSGYSCSQLPILQVTGTSTNQWGVTIDIGDGGKPAYFGGTTFCQ